MSITFPHSCLAGNIMCLLAFFQLQWKPLSLKDAGILINQLICPEAGGGVTERKRRRVETQMEGWRKVEGSGGAWLFLPLWITYWVLLVNIWVAGGAPPAKVWQSGGGGRERWQAIDQTHCDEQQCWASYIFTPSLLPPQVFPGGHSGPGKWQPQ